MEIYQEQSPRQRSVNFACDASKGTTLNHSGRKPLSNYNSNNNRHHATPHAKMKGEKRTVKVRSVSTTPLNVTATDSKENYSRTSPIEVNSSQSPPSSAQAFRRTLRGTSPKVHGKQIYHTNGSPQLGTEEHFFGDVDASKKISFAINREQRLLSKRPTLGGRPFTGGALGPPQRVAPKTPNSLLRTELDDSMDEPDESLLVSPPGALWNVLGVSHDPSSASSTGILIVPPTTAATIYEITTTQKKKQKQSPWASPPLQPRLLLSATPDSDPQARTKERSETTSHASIRDKIHDKDFTTKHELNDDVSSTDRKRDEKENGKPKSNGSIILTSKEKDSTTEHQSNDDVSSTNPRPSSIKKGVAIDLSMMFSEDGMQGHQTKVSKNRPPAHLLQRLQKSAAQRTTPDVREPTSVFYKEKKNVSSDMIIQRRQKIVDTKTSRGQLPTSSRSLPHHTKPSVSTEKPAPKKVTSQESSLIKLAPGVESTPARECGDGKVVVTKPIGRTKESVVSSTKESLSHQDMGKGKVRATNKGRSLKKSDEADATAAKRNACSTAGLAPLQRDSQFLEKTGTKTRVSLQKNSSFFGSSTTALSKVVADGDENLNDCKVQWTISKEKIAVEKTLLKQTIIKTQPPATIRREVHDWAGKQCETLVSWLNYTFQPDDEDDLSGPQRTGLRALVIHRRLAQVRHRAAELFRSEEMKRTRNIIQSEIARGRLSLRSDRDIHADLSLRTQATNLLLSYTTPWLRLGLEVMFGESIFPDSLHDPSDNQTTPVGRMRSALRTFVVHRVLSDSSILMKYTKGKTKVPSGKFEKLYREEMRTLVLYRLMVLILFLDHAKMENILDVPRLFTKSSEAKSSREVLLALCRTFLSAEGDFIKHLSRIGLQVSYVQDPIDELDFTVTNLATDLRDGACLTRMTEIVTKTRFKSMMRSLRLPAVSRLQKMHNVNVALSELSNYGVLVPKDVNAHHIVDAHREMVLKLMWSVIVQTCITKLLSATQIEHEIEIVLRSGHARRRLEGARDHSHSHTIPVNALCPQESTEDVLKSMLFRWSKAVCSNFGLSLIDLTGSFADGKAFCYLLHYYHPALLRIEEILPTSMDGREDLSEEQALENERANSVLASKRVTELGGIPRMLPLTDSKNPPDEKSIILCLAYLCSRLMESSEEIFATILIQACYRRYRGKVLEERKKAAAFFIFQFWAGHKDQYYRAQQRRYAAAVAVIEDFCWIHKHTLLKMKRNRLDLERRLNSAVHIQRYFRGSQGRKYFNNLLLNTLAATVIQKYFRRFKAQLDTLEMFLEKEAATQIQACWRSWRDQRNYKAIIPCAVKLQSIMRGVLVRTQLQQQHYAAKTIQKAWHIWVAYADSQVAAVIIQTHIRGLLARQYYRNLESKVFAARTIQRVWRGYSQLITYAITREFAIAIQKTVRRFLVTKSLPLQRMSKAAVMIQKTWRGFWTQVKYNLDVLDVVCIQGMVRARIAKQVASRRRHAIGCLQRSFRCFLSYRMMKTLQMQRELQIKQNNAAVVFQCAVRKWQAKKDLENRITEMKSVILVQNTWRQFLCKKTFLKSISAAKIIQAHCRRVHARRRWLALTCSVRKIQRRWRLHAFMKQRQKSATIIQAQWRCRCGFNIFRQVLFSAIVIQTSWRALRDSKKFASYRSAAVSIQASWRRYSARLNYELDILEIVIAQSAIRRMLAQRRTQKRRSSIKILQNSARRYLAGIQLQNLRCKREDNLRRCCAATLVQSMTRRYLATCFRRRALHAATVIAASWRMMMMKHRYHTLQRVIVKTQAFHRMRHVRMECRIRNYQATKIQSAWRRFFQHNKYSKTSSQIVVLQSMARRYMCKKRTTSMKVAILTLQCVARRYIAGQQLRKLQTERSIIISRNLAAQRIQAAFRGLVIRRSIWWEHSQATLIQACYRGHISRVSFALDRYDIIIVQSMIRTWLARRFLRSVRASIVALQATARAWIAHRVAMQLRIRKKADWTRNEACKVVQKSYRGYLVRRNIAVLKGSATRIQSCFRRHYQNVMYRMYLVDVITVQSLVRRWLACQRLKKAHTSAVVLQCLARRIRALELMHIRRSKKILWKRQNQASITMQRIWRGQQSRKRSKMHAAARKIQKTWRCFTAHVEYLVQQISVIRLQAQIRRYQSQRSFKKAMTGIIKLQAVARGFLQREYIRFISMSAIIVQSSYRRYQQRDAFLQAKRAAILIQGVARGFLVRDELILSHFAATEIQRVWRGFTQFCDFFVHVEAVVKIQSFFRMMRSVRLLAQLKTITQVERRFYNFKARSIQRAVRFYLHRLHLERASQVIQRRARLYIQHRRLTIVGRGVTKLQAVVRAAKVRRRRSKKVAAVVTRLDVANRKARNDPKLKIGYRTRHALHILQTSRSLAEIMDAVKSLETSTRLSSICCILFTEANAAMILLDLIRSCNRSVPHVELVQCILLTLDNVAQYRSLVPSFADCNAAEIFLDKMQMFRDKDGIFCLSTSLLGCIAKCNPIVEDFCAMHEHLKRLKALHALSLRRSKSSTSVSKQDVSSRLNRMRRREFFDRNVAIRSLGSMVANLESRNLVSITNENGGNQHFTF